MINLVIQKINPWSLAKISGIIYALFALVVLLIGTLFTLLNPNANDPGLGLLVKGLGIALPLIYGLVGFISGALVAVVYNFVAKLTGGVKIETGK